MKVITNYKTTLSASMTSSQNTVPVTSMLTTDDHTIIAADFDSVAYLVIEPGSANMEIVKVTGVSGSTFTGAVRGLAFYGGTETSVAGNQKAHQAGVEVIMTNAHYYFDKMMDLDSTETITGLKTFTAPNYPKMDDVSTPPVSDEEFATKKYVDDTAIAGGAKMTPSVYGIAKLSSAAADPTAPVVVNNEEVSAAGGTGAGENKIVKANASGYIDKDYIELDADPGLEFDTNALGVKIKAAGGLVKDANGLSVDTGTTDGKIVQMTTGDKLPAVDGSNLTNLNFDYNVGSFITGNYHSFQLNYGGVEAITDVITFARGLKNYGGMTQFFDNSNPPYVGFYLPGDAGTVGRMGFDEGKAIRIRCSIKLNTDGAFAFGLADSQLNSSGGTGADAQIRFQYDGTLKAYVGKGDSSGNLTSVTITGVTVTDYNDYVIEWDGADSAKFYVNNVLKATVTTNLPKADTGNILLQIGGTTNKYLYFTPIIVTKAK